LGRFKFRRQHRIGPYFAEFRCVARRLILELDVSQHAVQEAESQDALHNGLSDQQGHQLVSE